jgi:DNA repair protein RadA/Sms
VVLGEVGLAGEVRRITHPELRVREAAKLGFTRCIIPAGGGRKIDVPGIELTEVKSVGEALEKVM